MTVKNKSVSFRLRSDGVYMLTVTNKNQKEEERICSPLKVLALTRDDEQENWGRLVSVQDRDGSWHEHSLAMKCFVSDGCDIFALLLSSGLELEKNDRSTREAVLDYISHATTHARALCVSKTGWYKDVFVLPDTIIGSSNECIVFQRNY